jgi:hypothetical protein
MNRARIVFSTSPGYNDLTLTQYSSALDWLHSVGFVDDQGVLTDPERLAAQVSPAEALLQAAIEEAQPPWIRDADILVDSLDDLPADLVHATEALALGLHDGLAAVRNVWGKVDARFREEIGRAGELALVQLLRVNTASEITHIADRADGYGYDIVVRDGTRRANVEVKSTNRRGRLSFFLSRNEYDVMLSDPNWHLVVLLLDDSRRPAAIGSLDSSWIREKAPSDRTSEGRWQSARFNAPPSATRPGLVTSIPWAFSELPPDHILTVGYIPEYQPAWLQPTRRVVLS